MGAAVRIIWGGMREEEEVEEESVEEEQGWGEGEDG